MIRQNTKNHLLENWLNNKFNLVEKEITKWAFMRCRPNHKLEINFIDGSKGGYQGVGFEGSPQEIFWSDKYIPEYVKIYILEGIDYAIDSAKKYDSNPNSWLEDFLKIVPPLIDKTYDRMIEIESRLLGDGFNPAKSNNSHKNKFLSLKCYLEDVVKGRKLSTPEIIYWWIKKYQLILGVLVASFIAYLFRNVLN
jgi:hypothetical protein